MGFGPGWGNNLQFVIDGAGRIWDYGDWFIGGDSGPHFPYGFPIDPYPPV